MADQPDDIAATPPPSVDPGPRSTDRGTNAGSRANTSRVLVRRAAAVAVLAALAATALWWQSRSGDSRTATATPAASSAARATSPSAGTSPPAPATTVGAAATTGSDPLCGALAVMPEMSHEPGPAGTVHRTASGRWERVVEGADPHVDVSRYPFTQQPTARQEAAAQRFAGTVRRAAVAHGWEDPRRALAAGYRPMQRCGTHWVNVSYALDDQVLDPDRPEFLIYENHGHGLHLDSVMFTAAANGSHGPQPFGPAAVWHLHLAGDQCMRSGIIVTEQVGTGCPAGSRRYRRTVEMLHVMMDPSYGPFALGM